MFKFQLVFHSVTLAKKSIPPEFPQTLDEFPEEKGLYLVVLDSPPHQKVVSTSPMVHTPKRAAHKIEQSLDSPRDRTTGLKAEEPITVGPKRFPDSPFPRRLSPTPYHRPGTPYRKVNLPGAELAIETLESGILDKTEDSFEIDSESERTLREEPKEPTEHKEPQNPKFDLNRSEMPEGITKRKLAPPVLPFESNTDKDLKLKTEPKKVIVRLK